VSIIEKAVGYLVTFIVFIILITYVYAIHPKIEQAMGSYSVGFADGGILIFLLTSIPLAYVYFREKEKKEKSKK
jgi:hypothetical protein